MKLVVIQAFESYSVGDEITEQEAIDAILVSEQSAFVVKVAVSSKPAKK